MDLHHAVSEPELRRLHKLVERLAPAAGWALQAAALSADSGFRALQRELSGD